MFFRFGDFTLDEERLELARGGAKLAIQPQPRDVLLHLLKNRHRVVGKRELVDAVWGGVMLSETVLAQTMLRLRRALEDDPEQPRMVETIRGRGYRFIASVTEHVAHDGSAPRPFVGRGETLAAIDARFDGAAAGRGSVVLIGGEPGLGKSRLLEVLAKRLRARGARVALVYGYDEGRGASLWPFREAARSIAEQASLAPPVAEGVVGSEASGEAFAVHEVFARFFKDAARDAPIVLLVDDLHAADAGSIALLKLLARAAVDARVLVVAAYRDAAPAADDALARALGAVLRVDPSARLALTALAAAEVAELARATLGRAPEPVLLARLVEKGAGNPLLVTQLLHATNAGEGNAASTSSLLDEVALQEAIFAQLQGVPEACARALAVGSVFGTSFDAGALAVVAGHDVPGLLEALEPALRARVIVKTGAAHRYRFAHALVRDLLYKRLGGAERIALHRAAAEALLAFAPDPRGEDLDAIAKHFVAAAGADGEPALAWSVRAAESAEERGDTNRALNHLWAARAALRLRKDVRSASAHASLVAMQANPALKDVATELLSLLPAP